MGPRPLGPIGPMVPGPWGPYGPYAAMQLLGPGRSRTNIGNTIGNIIGNTIDNMRSGSSESSPFFKAILKVEFRDLYLPPFLLLAIGFPPFFCYWLLPPFFYWLLAPGWRYYCQQVRTGGSNWLTLRLTMAYCIAG